MSDPNSTGSGILIGNTYNAEVRYVCKQMRDGGCVIRTYCVLTFKEKEVEVLYYSKAVCTPKEREAHYSNMEPEKETYTWSEQNNTITIHAFNKYGTFKIKGDILIASKGLDGDVNVEPLNFTKC